MKRNNLAILSSLVVTAFFLETAQVSAKTGAAFLKVDPSPRSFAMGGTNSVMAFGAQAIGANPANLGVVKKKFEMLTSYSNLVTNEQYSHVAFAINRNTNRRHLIEGVGLSVTHLKVSDIDGRDRSGGKTGSFGSLDRSISLTASSLVTNSLRLGMTGKFITSELAGYSSGLTMAGDFGMNYDISRDRMPMSFGLALRNFGQGIKYLNQTDSMPTSVDAGVGVGIGPGTIVMELNQLINEQKTNFGVGMEFGVGPVSLRAGLSSAANRTVAQDRFVSAIQNFSSGIGLKLGTMKLDYALSSQLGDFGLTHRVSLTLQWGASLSKPRPRLYGPLPEDQY